MKRGYSISSTSNRLLSVSGLNNRSYSYAANGAIIDDGIHTYSYDPRGRLIGVDSNVSYTLNGLGERIRKTVSGASTLFVYDEQGQLIGEYDASGTPITETVYLDTQPVGALKGNAIYYVHTDHLSAPRVITDTTDTIIWRWDSDPFGTTAANDDPDQDTVSFAYNLRFPGQYYDQETGLHYNYYRDYDPITGRYVQSDPIGLAGGLNTYAYVESAPLMWVDPDGLDLMDPIWGAIYGITGGWSPSQATVNIAAGFGDAFLVPELIRDAFDIGDVNKCSVSYKDAKMVGFVWGSVPFVLRGAAWMGGTRAGHWLNHGPHWRIGPGRMPNAGSGLPSGGQIPRVAIGRDFPGSNHFHRDLRSRIPYVPPIGGVTAGND